MDTNNIPNNPWRSQAANLVFVHDALRANRARLPQQLLGAKRWMLWKLQFGDPRHPSEKPRKVPYYVDSFQRCGALDLPEDIARLASYDDAMNVLVFGDSDYEGLGFALGPDGAGGFWRGIDLDDVSKNHLSDLANALPSYVEMSPSGNGAHAIGTARSSFPSVAIERA